MCLGRQRLPSILIKQACLDPFTVGWGDCASSPTRVSSQLGSWKFRYCGFSPKLSGGRKGAFPPSCSLLSPLLPPGLYLSCPPSSTSHSLSVCAVLRSRWEGPQQLLHEKLLLKPCFFRLSQLHGHLGTVKGSSQGQTGPWQPWGRGRWLLPHPYCAGNSAGAWVSLSLILFHHRYVLLVQSLWQERLQSHYSNIRRMKQTFSCWHFSLSSVFFKSTLEKKRKSSAQAGDFIIHIWHLSRKEYSCWFGAYLSYLWAARLRETIFKLVWLSSFYPVCSLILWRGA